MNEYLDQIVQSVKQTLVNLHVDKTTGTGECTLAELGLIVFAVATAHVRSWGVTPEALRASLEHCLSTEKDVTKPRIVLS